jgi:hypothetical protein
MDLEVGKSTSAEVPQNDHRIVCLGQP